MNFNFFSEAKEHRILSEELYATAWWQALMNDPHFQSAFERNYHMRLKLGDSSYLKMLLDSECERRDFIEQVFHPEPEHLAAQDEE